MTSGTEMPLYFAYGSNMAKGEMEAKCPMVAVIGPARLEGHRLTFNRRSIRTGTGVANIVADPNAVVWGVLYEVSEACLEKLNRKEGYPWAYDQAWLNVTLQSGARRRALSYVVATPEAEEVAPSAEYLHGIVSAARDRGLPAPYIESLSARFG